MRNKDAIISILRLINGQKAGLGLHTDWSQELAEIRSIGMIQVDREEAINLVKWINRTDTFFSKTNHEDVMEVIDALIPIQRKLVRQHHLTSSELRDTPPKGAILFSQNLTEEGAIVMDELFGVIRTILNDESRIVEGEHLDKNSGKRAAVLLLALERSGYIVPIDNREHTVKNWRRILNVCFGAGIKSDEAISFHMRDTRGLRHDIEEMQCRIEEII